MGRQKIRIEGITKKLGEEQVIQELSHAFESGRVHGIVGNNGSGKTVLFKCICGFMKPDTGKIYVDDRQIGRETDFPGDTGIIIETPGFLPYRSGRKNLEILASLNGRVGKEAVIRVLEMVGLDPDMKKPVVKYSLGMRQRLGIAQAIMENPSLLILDEPFNGLDKYGGAHIRELLLKLKREGKTILIASHNQGDIEFLCDTVCEMDEGVLSVIRS